MTTLDLYRLICVDDVTPTNVTHDPGDHFMDCMELVTLIPMYHQGGLSGAWYPEVGGDEPDGWLWREPDDDS